MKCVACRADAPTVTEDEIAQLHPQVPDWELVEEDGIKRLRRVFRFGIKPSRVSVCYAARHDIIIIRRAFPAANRVRFAFSEILCVYRVCRKIVISFDHNGFIAFG